jgi:hypothetical protein
MLLNGESPVTPIIFAMSASDAEGNVARLIDKHFPNSGLGSSKIGAEWDPIADTGALLIVGGASLFAPRLSYLSRVSIALALGHEGYKSAWAIGKNKQYGEVASGRLQIKPTIEGKESMAEKFTAVGLAILSSDFDNPDVRRVLSAGALAMAVTGTLRAESQRRIYDEMANELIAQASYDNIQQ